MICLILLPVSSSVARYLWVIASTISITTAPKTKLSAG
jgi:hypothetical protein